MKHNIYRWRGSQTSQIFPFCLFYFFVPPSSLLLDFVSCLAWRHEESGLCSGNITSQERASSAGRKYRSKLTTTINSLSSFLHPISHYNCTSCGSSQPLLGSKDWVLLLRSSSFSSAPPLALHRPPPSLTASSDLEPFPCCV